jgi:hypothetical protein
LRGVRGPGRNFCNSVTMEELNLTLGRTQSVGHRNPTREMTRTVTGSKGWRGNTVAANGGLTPVGFRRRA